MGMGQRALWCALAAAALLLSGLGVRASPPELRQPSYPFGRASDGRALATAQLSPLTFEEGGTLTGALPIEPPAAPELDPLPALTAQVAPEAKVLAVQEAPDLRPYALPAWSYPVTPSSMAGTSTVNALYAGKPTFFDWAVLNDSSGWVTSGFQTYLYIDGVRVATWRTSGLQPRWYTYVRDWVYVVAAPGWHTVTLVTDATRDIPESNEFNNQWQGSFYWQPSSEPNLKPYQPDGWSGPIVASSVQGSNVANTLYVGQPTYISWAITNESNVATTARIRTDLYLDANRIGSWQTDPLLPNWYAHISNWQHIVMAPGWHTLRLVVDVEDVVAESNETDNIYEARFYWRAEAKPNLRPYQPAGWPAPLVLSAVPEAIHTGFCAGRPVYIDWAVINDSSQGISNRFYQHLYVDGTLVGTWHTDLVAGQWRTLITDWTYIVPEPGWHTFKLVVDATNVVAESNEDDNAWEVTAWFYHKEEKSVGVEWANSYINSGLPILFYNEYNASGFYEELGRLGWLQAFNWGENSAWEKDFRDVNKGGLDHRVIDTVAFAYFSGHGTKEALRFDTREDDFELRYDEARWGDVALNWFVADACRVLNNDDGGAIARWGQAFAGLHMILGFDTECSDVPYRGENLARYAGGTYWWANAMPLKDAWFQAAAVTEGPYTYSAVLIAVAPPADPTSDFLPGVGGYSPDPTNPMQFHLWRVQN